MREPLLSRYVRWRRSEPTGTLRGERSPERWLSEVARSGCDARTALNALLDHRRVAGVSQPACRPSEVK